MSKFKGKRIDTKEWVYGSLIKGENGERFIVNHAEIIELDGKKTLSIGQWYNVIPKTVGQYTGFKTKSGVEIYEGDITKRRWLRGNEVRYAEEVIIFDNGAFWCALKGGGGGELLGSHLTKVIPSQIEVIGNIHDNSER